MTEKEYVIVSDLRRCETASRALRDTLPHLNPNIDKKELVDVVQTIERWIGKMFEAIGIK